jgi:pimeloyl-ACP methyl ester carboxylesterase
MEFPMSREITRRQMLVTGAVAGTAAALAPLSSAAAATARPPGTGAVQPTIVLVHGGYADSSCWNQTLSYLQGWGYTTICGANPLRGIPTDAPYIASLLDSIAGPVLLVGHSMGGTVTTNAAAGKSNVKALVYIAAFVPDVGETQADLINKYPGSEVLPVSVPVPYTKADGTTGTDLYLSQDGQAAFCADIPKGASQLLQATQRPFDRTPSSTQRRPPDGTRSRCGGWSPAKTRPFRPRPSAGCTAVRTPRRSSRCQPRPTARCLATRRSSRT